MKTLEDYQKRHAHIIKYTEYMIEKYKRLSEQYPNSYEITNAQRKAYKDILIKLTGEFKNK